MNFTPFGHPFSHHRDKVEECAQSGIAAQEAHWPSQKERATRYSLLIRAAKLVSSHGEFVCVIRDISETGVSLRLFHAPPTGNDIELHMPNGGIYRLNQVWHDTNEVGYEFVEDVDLSQLVEDQTTFPKRRLRLGLFVPIFVRSIKGLSEGVIDNMSQQGAHFICDSLFAIDQNLRVECAEEAISFSEVGATVRWRRDSEYGVVFENTLSLEEFARLAAEIQCPALLR